MNILGPGDPWSGHQDSKRGTMSGPKLNYLYTPVTLTASDRVLSNFRNMLSSPNCTTHRSFFHVADLGSSGGYDFAMPNLWGEYSNNSYSENNRDICFILSLLCFTSSIGNNT